MIDNFKQSKLKFMPGYCFFYSDDQVNIDTEIID